MIKLGLKVSALLRAPGLAQSPSKAESSLLGRSVGLEARGRDGLRRNVSGEDFWDAWRGTVWWWRTGEGAGCGEVGELDTQVGELGTTWASFGRGGFRVTSRPVPVLCIRFGFNV